METMKHDGNHGEHDGNTWNIYGNTPLNLLVPHFRHENVGDVWCRSTLQLRRWQLAGGLHAAGVG